MYPRTEYEMTQEALDELLEQMKPQPAMMIGGTVGRTQQERANDAWARLGTKMGFDSATVQPLPGGGMLRFTAVPAETKEQKEIRERTKQRDEKLHRLDFVTSGIQQLEKEKAELVESLSALL